MFVICVDNQYEGGFRGDERQYDEVLSTAYVSRDDAIRKLREICKEKNKHPLRDVYDRGIQYSRWKVDKTLGYLYTIHSWRDFPGIDLFAWIEERKLEEEL